MFNVEGLLGHIYLFSSDPLMVAAFIFIHNEEIQQFKSNVIVMFVDCLVNDYGKYEMKR